MSDGADSADLVVQRAQRMLGVRALLILAVTAGAGQIGALPRPALGALAGPVTLLGLVGPVIGHRVFLWQRDRAAGLTDEARRHAAFFRAYRLAPIPTEAIALTGVLLHLATGDPWTLVGVATHVLLVGAIWPSPGRLEEFGGEGGAGVTSSYRPVFLSGFMGSGKSTLGRAMAGVVGRPFVDLDQLIESAEGRTIEDLFARDGEAVFRRIEHDRLVGIDTNAHPIVACGGGIAMARANRIWMRGNGFTIWLDVPLRTLRERVGAGAGRPLWRAGIGELYLQRRAAYALCDLRVAVRDEAPEETLEHIQRRAPHIFR